jgi:hypothetical protein
MKTISVLVLILLTAAASLNVRLSHDNRKGYAYVISGPSVEEVIEADQQMRRYLKSLAPKKGIGPAPAKGAAGPIPGKR